MAIRNRDPATQAAGPLTTASAALLTPRRRRRASRRPVWMEEPHPLSQAVKSLI